MEHLIKGEHMSFQLTPISECDIIQAAEWMLFQWFPLSKSDEQFHIQGRKRRSNPNNDINYQQKAVILLEALQAKALFLYDQNGNQITLETQNNSGNSLRDYIRENIHDSPKNRFDLLKFIMTQWYNNEPLFFRFSELEREFPQNQPQVVIVPELRIYYDRNCVFLQTRQGKILLKRFNEGTSKKVIKTLMNNPNKSFDRDDLLDGLVTDQRIDNIIRTFKQKAKEAIEESEDLNAQEKQQLKSKIDSSFSVRYGTYLFTPLT